MRAPSLAIVPAVLGTLAFAAPRNAPSDAPYFVLADNLDEPNGYGFCLETAGRNLSDFAQTYSCKPASTNSSGTATPHDAQFAYGAEMR